MTAALDHRVLREMMSPGRDWVSGAALASRLGVSRVAVWQQMEKLRSQGFDFEARRSRGYRLAAFPPSLHPALIEAWMGRRPRDFSLVVMDEVDSTNDEAARLLAAGRPAPFAVLARRQTRGRGRFGRAWHSDDDRNLYASFAFRPRLAPERMQTFTLWMGVNLCDLIVNFAQVRPGLKWPNDIVFDGRKAGGMLTEARIDADHIRDLVFGLGLNVNGMAERRPTDLRRAAVSLAEVRGALLDLNRLAAAIVGRVLLAYGRFLEGAPRDTFAELWGRHDVLRGREVTVVEGGRRHPGVVVGVDDEGALVLKGERGRTQRFKAGEVTLEKDV